jgi:hypothetical protein
MLRIIFRFHAVREGLLKHTITSTPLSCRRSPGDQRRRATRAEECCCRRRVAPARLGNGTLDTPRSTTPAGRVWVRLTDSSDECHPRFVAALVHETHHDLTLPALDHVIVAAAADPSVDRVPAPTVPRRHRRFCRRLSDRRYHRGGLPDPPDGYIGFRMSTPTADALLSQPAARLTW